MNTKLGKFLFKSLCCAALLILAAVPASADYSLLYSFSSGDTRLPSTHKDYVQPLYGIGRIDFVESDDYDHYLFLQLFIQTRYTQSV